jgi:type I restriction-modification system DNA methylase subunit
MKAKETDCIVNHEREIITLIRQASHSRSIYQVFCDFLEMSAISLSNTIDFTRREEREARYLQIINSYTEEHRQLFPRMLAHLIEALEEKIRTVGPEDVLGSIFHTLELHTKCKGQFFTPQPVSDFMAELSCGDEIKKTIKEKGFVNLCEPAVGSGVMVTSFCKAMQKAGLNYQSQLVVTAVDIDAKCVWMTYLQLALYGVPAVVIHGDSLTCEEWSRWYTPLYLLNGWLWRQRCTISTKICEEGTIVSTPTIIPTSTSKPKTRDKA